MDGESFERPIWENFQKLCRKYLLRTELKLNETLNELRHFWYNTENLHSVDAELDDCTTCAACFDVPTGINSFDADFQQVRKQSDGKNCVNPKRERHFYLPQQEVDNFMALY